MLNNRIFHRLSYVIIFVLLFAGCKERNRFYIAGFDQETQVSIHRFDLDFIRIDTVDVEKGLRALEAKYPDFFGLYFNNGLGLDPAGYERNAALVKDFLTNPQFINVHREVEKVFGNTASYEQQINRAYSYLKHYFPDISLPEIYFFVSGFNHQFLLTDSIIGVGSDVYLGSDFNPYQELTYEYLIPNMRPEMLVPELLTELLHHHFPFSGELNLLSAMIHEGKIMYLLSVLLPESGSKLLIGYSEEQVSWCNKHASQVWTRILENRDLFSTDNLLITQYMQVAPFTSPVSQESPGRLGVWTGWQIVKSYMQNNKDIDLEQLMNNTQYQKILEKSGYKP
jgi:hypothetical protein